jgi:hypothetical protein
VCFPRILVDFYRIRVSDTSLQNPQMRSGAWDSIRIAARVGLGWEQYCLLLTLPTYFSRRPELVAGATSPLCHPPCPTLNHFSDIL